MASSRTETLDRALRSLPDGPAAQPVRVALLGAHEALHAPLRVAVAGRVSSGKSTLVNALIGDELLVTGINPVTFTVCVLRHAPTPSLTVRFSGGTGPESRPLSDLHLLTARDADGAEPEGLDHVEIRGPFPHLGAFELVDTPGFGSRYTADTAAAMRALGVTPDAVARSTAGQLRRSDAVIAVLNTALAGQDADLLTRFRGADGTSPSLTPITAIGVLTKVELLWPGEVDDPRDDVLALGRDHARRIMADPGTRRLLHDVIPVCSKLSEGAAGLTEEEVADLAILSRTPEALLRARLDDRRGFATRQYDDLPLPPERRGALVARLSQYGVFLASRLVREGADTPAELGQALEAASGMEHLRRTLLSHFGERSELIKLGRIVDAARDLRTRQAPAEDPRVRARIGDALRMVTDWEHDEPAFVELRLLQQWYERRLDIPDAAGEELERAVGERGTSVADRLGFPHSSTPPSLARLERAALERVAHWRRSSMVTTPGLRQVAPVLERRYAQLYDRVRQARILLGEELT
ncbi:dynamin family protein [Streptomyces sp. NPDC058676]|uniref:dynamin family protein n=1 Tax=unclassified Streptomyces TaxID=2593676 RepID=UPI00365AEE96